MSSLLLLSSRLYKIKYKTISLTQLVQPVIVRAFRQSDIDNHNTNINLSNVKHSWERYEDNKITYFKQTQKNQYKF